MKKKSLKPLLNWVRITLFVVSIMAMLSVVIWRFTPNVVNKVDNLFVSTYKSYYKRPFKKAKKVLKKDKAKGITALESFLNKVAEVKVSDRLDGLKYQAYPLLIKNLMELELTEKALYWVDDWLAFHEKDIFAQVVRAELLLDIPSREKEGREALSQLFEKFPEVPVVTEAYIGMIDDPATVNNFMNQAAKLRLQRFLRSEMTLFWKGAGENFSESRKISVPIVGKIVSGQVDFDLMFPMGCSIAYLRIDFPEIIDVEYTLNEIRLFSEEDILINLNDIDVVYKNNLKESGSKFFVTGDDPHFAIKIENIESPITHINVNGCVK